MEKNNMTAVEYLMNHFRMLHIWHDGEPDEMLEAFEQAKQMEKEKLKECWDVAHQAGRFEGKGVAEENWQTFEGYYNEAYGKTNSN